MGVVGRRGAWLALVVLWLGGSGCGDSSSTADDGGGGDEGADADADADGDGDADADADADGDDGGGTGTLSVLVLGSPLLLGTEWPPLEGAAVAFDLPGGGRVEGTTDATGRVSFDGFDWAAGTGAVTAWADGWGLASQVGLDGSAEDLTLFLPNLSNPTDGWVDVVVRVTNAADDTHRVGVGVVEASTMADGTGATPSFLVRVPPSQPFTIGAAEYTLTAPSGPAPYARVDVETFSYAFQESPGVAARTSIDLDLSHAVPATTVSGSFSTPPLRSSSLRAGFPYAVVFPRVVKSRGPFYFQALYGIGCPTYAEKSPSYDTVSYELAYYLPPTPPSVPVTRYYLWINENIARLLGGSSLVDVEGLPTAGAQTFEFLDVPQVEHRDPANPLHEPISWLTAETDVTPTLYLRRVRSGTGDVNLWWITAPTDATTLTVPQPPSAVDFAAVLGTSIFRAVVGIRANVPGEGVQERYAESALFQVQP